ncbi:MAG: ABC transporter ATP-binding protein [Bacteroidota bacterium]|nr:ABC transporter ATP-binding protein [Bacteroidota bacterium]
MTWNGIPSYLYKQKNEFVIRTQNLKRIFSTDEVETIALEQVNIEIKKGEFVAIMGPSGCGKSTLLNILGLLDYPSAGVYYFMDKDVTRYPERKKALLRKSHIGFVFQNFNLIEELTIYENIELPLIYLGINNKDRRQRVETIMEEMRITHRRNNFPSQLSGGQQQKVAVARAVVSKPGLILADEPTGNLDSANGEEVMNLLSRLNQNGTTIVMVTHSQRDAEYSKRIIHLFDGKIVTENIRQSFYL